MSKRRIIYIFTYLTLLLALGFAGIVSLSEPGGHRRGIGPVIRKVVHMPLQMYERMFIEEVSDHPLLAPAQEIQELLHTGQPDNRVPELNVLLSLFDTELGRSKVILSALPGGESLAEWVPPAEDAALWDSYEGFEAPDPAYLRLIRPLLLADSSVVVVRESGPVVRLSRKGEILWLVEGAFSPTLEADAVGNFWTCRMVWKPEGHAPMERVSFIDNVLTCISPEGNVLREISVAGVLEASGLSGLVLGVNTLEEDPLHCTDVDPALYGSAFWEKGDILVSIGNKSLLCLIRPGQPELLWYRFGPWIHPTDADFTGDASVTVLGTGLVRRPVGPELLLPGIANLYELDLTNDSVYVPYPDIFSSVAFGDHLETGRFDISDGTIVVEDSEQGLLAGWEEEGRGSSWHFGWTTPEGQVMKLSGIRFLHAPFGQ